MKKYTIKLSPRERKQVEQLTLKGKRSARAIRRAHIILDSNDGLTDESIAERRRANVRTVARIRERCAIEGWKEAVFDKPRSGQPKRLDNDGEAKLVAVACSDPPHGHYRWTLELLRDRLIADGIVDTISTVAIHLRLKARGLKPWLKKNVVCP